MYITLLKAECYNQTQHALRQRLVDTVDALIAGLDSGILEGWCGLLLDSLEPVCSLLVNLAKA